MKAPNASWVGKMHKHAEMQGGDFLSAVLPKAFRELKRNQTEGRWRARNPTKALEGASEAEKQVSMLGDEDHTQSQRQREEEEEEEKEEESLLN